MWQEGSQELKAVLYIAQRMVLKAQNHVPENWWLLGQTDFKQVGILKKYSN